MVAGLGITEYEADEAKRRQKARKGKQPGATKENFLTCEAGQTRDKVAAYLGWSGKTYEKAKPNPPQTTFPAVGPAERSGRSGIPTA